MTNKYVKLAADYSSSGLWHEEGYMMYPNELPVTAQLLFRIKEWVRDYDYNCPYDDSPSDWDEIKHAKTGRVIAYDIKSELPNWTVMYFDEPILEWWEVYFYGH